MKELFSTFKRMASPSRCRPSFLNIALLAALLCVQVCPYSIVTDIVMASLTCKIHIPSQAVAGAAAANASENGPPKDCPVEIGALDEPVPSLTINIGSSKTLYIMVSEQLLSAVYLFTFSSLRQLCLLNLFDDLPTADGHPD